MSLLKLCLRQRHAPRHLGAILHQADSGIGLEETAMDKIMKDFAHQPDHMITRSRSRFFNAVYCYEKGTCRPGVLGYPISIILGSRSAAAIPLAGTNADATSPLTSASAAAA